MKIAMTNVDLPNEGKGGVPHQAHYLANALAGRGHEVTMFTFSPAYDKCRYDVHQYFCPRWLRRRHALSTFLFAACLARTDFSGFDVVHASGDNYLLRHPHLRTFYGSASDEAKSAVRTRRRVYQSLVARLEDVGARRATINIGISEATRDRIPAVTTIIPCGVDVSAFRPGPKADVPALLFVGTTGGRKRGTLLAEVFQSEVRAKFPDAHLWAVTEKPLEGAGIVNWGKVPLEKLTELYQQAWVFCLPSTYEGFGVPYIEAMASGTPAVASPNFGAKEVLQDGEYGLLTEDAELGQAINSLLGDAGLRSAYAAKGLIRAQEFSWQRVVRQYEGIFEEVAGVGVKRGRNPVGSAA